MANKAGENTQDQIREIARLKPNVQEFLKDVDKFEQRPTKAFLVVTLPVDQSAAKDPSEVVTGFGSGIRQTNGQSEKVTKGELSSMVATALVGASRLDPEATAYGMMRALDVISDGNFSKFLTNQKKTPPSIQ